MGERVVDDGVKGKAKATVDLDGFAVFVGGDLELSFSDLIARGVFEAGVVGVEGPGFPDLTGAVGGDVDGEVAAGVAGVDRRPDDGRLTGAEFSHGGGTNEDGSEAVVGRGEWGEESAGVLDCGEVLQDSDVASEFGAGFRIVDELAGELLLPKPR